VTRSDLIWRMGAPARLVCIGLIKAYRLTLSGVLGGQCRFYPSCSQYGEDAIRARGVLVGIPLVIWRVLRCNPFGAGGLDPAPDGRMHDGVIHSSAGATGSGLA
jgi:putative membrane protein insertion efficiency factor